MCTVRNQVRSSYGLAFCILSTLVVLNGCASLDTKPFTTLTASAQSLHDNSDKVLSSLQTELQDQYVADLLLEPSRVKELRLVEDTAPFPTAPINPPATNAAATTAAPPAPSFDAQYLEYEKSRLRYSGGGGLPLQLANFRAGMLHLNQGLVDYAIGLQALADPNVISDDGLNALATDANANLRAGRDTLKLTHVSNSDIAIFTTAGVEAFRLYLQYEQRSDLIAAMRAAQERMPYVSAAGREACFAQAVLAWGEYGRKFDSLAGRITGVPLHGDKAATTDDERRQLILAVIALNERHMELIDALDAIHGAYLKLPQAHAAMIASVENNELSLAGIAAFLSEIKRIDTTYENLKSVPDSSNTKKAPAK